MFWSKAEEDEEDDDAYQVEHSVICYLMAPGGEFVEFFLQSDPETKIIDCVLGHLRETAAKA